MRIVIAGAGIAGLTCALSLASAGFEPVILESVEQPAPLGVGINLLPHATREFYELGVLPAITELGVEIEALDYLMSDGREVWHEPRGKAAGYRWPQIAVHRGRFQMRLADLVRERLGADAIQFGRAVEKVRHDGNHVAIFASDRASGLPVEIEADLLIAADGIHSAIRRQFHPGEGRPAWNGITLYRGVTVLPADTVSPRMIWAGHARQKFAGYPFAIDRRRNVALFNWICDLKTGDGNAPPREDWNRDAKPEPLMTRYRDWRWPGLDVPAIVAAAEGIWQFPMVDRDPLQRWTHGRTTLIGDAAHPMYPIGSNGATQAIIDARAIAFHLSRGQDVESALQAYEADRREKTSSIVLLNRQHGPDQVLELAAERAPTRDHDLSSLLPMSERAEVAARYKHAAGFDPQVLNKRQSYSC